MKGLELQPQTKTTTMKSLIYSLLPYSVIQAIRRRRDKARRYKLALRERPRVYGNYLDPI
jgi:hypothetical protein